MDPSSTIMDELQIKALLVRERFYRDSMQWQKLRDSYHPDATKTAINISWYRGDIDGFVAGSQAMAAGGASASHTITPVEVTFNSATKKALSLSTGSITVRFERAGRLYDCVSWTRFVSRLEKTAEGIWKMLSLECIYERDSIAPVVPGEGEGTGAASFSEMTTTATTARQSYRCLAWLLAQKGYVINGELPGLDWPESVRSFMDEQNRWLAE